MKKCPQCGFELNDNARFCEECGAAIPQEKECPMCHAKSRPSAKFCVECGYRFSAVEQAGTRTGFGSSFSLGDKNMVAGDVIGKKVVVERGATVIHNEDESRRLVKCHICNRNMVISESVECPCCGELVCEGCYDRGLTLCSSCKKEAIRGLTIGGNVGKTQDNRITKDIMLNVMRKAFGIQLDGTVLKKYKYDDQIKEFAIPSGITEIAGNAFSESGIVAVEIPSSVKIIRDNAFLECSELRKVILRGEPESIGEHVFDGCRSLSEITVSDELAKNYPDTIIKLGICLKSNKGFSKGSAEAVRLFFRAAEQGHAEVQYKLGECYWNGIGVDKDHAEAVKWYRKAAEQGHESALEKMSSLKDVPALFDAAEQGDLNAMIELGKCYFDGKCVEKDHKEAAKWYRKAAEKDIAEAQYELGKCYWNGIGVDRDAEAVKWYRKAAEKGHAEAQTFLGWLCFEGIGVKKDYAEAVRWYRLAAEQGHAEAQTFLGWFCFEGIGVKKDYAEAVKWYRKAAEKGHADAQYNLGLCYVNGEGVKKDDVEAVKWFRKAAEQGDESALEKMSSLKDVPALFDAAEQGDLNAMIELGKCYDAGKGVEKDDTEAVKWYRKAAEKGNTEAQFELGKCYDAGKGVWKNYAEAFKWYRRSAEQGHVEAQNVLGECYWNGNGVDKDHAEAVKWWVIAVKHGSTKAQANLDDYCNGGVSVLRRIKVKKMLKK